MTLTVLLTVWLCISYLAYRLAMHGLQSVGETAVFAIVLILLLLLAFFIVVCMKKRITIDTKNRCVVLEYVRYPTLYFDIYPKRRVEVPFAEIASVEPGLMYNGGTRLSWHVHTRSSRFEFTAYMKDEKRLRGMLSEIALANRIPDEECRYLRRGISFYRVLWISVACVFVAAVGYAIFVFVI